MADRNDRNDFDLNESERLKGRSMDDTRAELGTNDVPESFRAAGGKHGDDASGKEKASAGAVGGLGGAAAGAALGTVVAGPIGTAVGALAGALGGWWAGNASVVATDYKDDDDAYYREHYESEEERLADRRYDDVRPAYQLGHVARRNPDYDGRAFDEIESDLQKGWTDDLRTKHGDWPSVRRHAQAAYSRNPDLEPETTSERTVIRASETARDKLAGGRGGLTRDDTVGY